MLVAAFDPGRNVGFALVDGKGRLLRNAVIQLDKLDRLELPKDATIVVGNGTGSYAVRHILKRRGVETIGFDEKGTSLEARELYFRDHRPRLPWRLLPKGMWVPARAIDDYAAYAIALRFLKSGMQDPDNRWIA